MSNALAIASVTAVLKDLLDNALIDHSVNSAVGSPVTVTALPPDRIKPNNNNVQATQLNLFMYHVSPNAAWRNVGLPSRNERGEHLSNPPLALDLYYLLSAYGNQDFVAEILLGYAMQMLHETPVLTRDAIRRTLGPPAPVEGGGILPPALAALSASDLADQIEQIKLTPQSMNSEDMSKLWTAFQVGYRPSVVYQASVVLIEADRPAPNPLPVLTRGAADAGVAVQPNTEALPPPFAALVAVQLPNNQTIAQPGDTLTLTGFNLAGDSVAVRFMNPRLANPIPLTPAPASTARQITVTLPDVPADWVVGIYSVQAIVSRTGQPDETTNALSFALAPRITAITPDPAARDANGRVTLSVTCRPEVRPAQRASLFLGAREIFAQPHAVQTGTLSFQVDAAPPGEHLVRLRVDGVDSVLVDRSVTPPVFSAPRVTIT